MKSKTKLKHIFFLASFCLAAIACGGHVAQPASGIDMTLLPAGLLSISPKGPEDKRVEQLPAPASESKATNQVRTVDN